MRRREFNAVSGAGRLFKAQIPTAIALNVTLPLLYGLALFGSDHPFFANSRWSKATAFRVAENFRFLWNL